MKKNSFWIILLLLLLCVGIAFLMREEEIPNNTKPPKPIDVTEVTDFDFKMIKQTHNYYSKKNYMISPLSIAYALSMLNEGAEGQTKKEISELLGDYKTIGDVNVKDKIGIANLIFIRNRYKNDISKDFINTLKTKHDSEVMFDDFVTPKPVNDWVNKKTFKMIKDPVDSLSEDFVLGLANAIAIDVEWANKFECNRTKEEEFTKENKTKMQVAMMSSSNDVSYIESKNAKGIIKDYAIYDKTTGKRVYEENDNTVALEYIAILPNKTIDAYMKLFNQEELKTLLNNKKDPSEKLDINLKLPKYTYDFDYDKFQDSLVELGMKDAFNSSAANFKSMVNDESELELFVSKAIHKSHIELSENGTKAAAVTIFLMEKNSISLPDEKEVINIEFNKPFIYLIKEKNSNNIWFFGTVYEPLKWEDNDTSKCEIE